MRASRHVSTLLMMQYMPPSSNEKTSVKGVLVVVLFFLTIGLLCGAANSSTSSVAQGFCMLSFFVGFLAIVVLATMGSQKTANDNQNYSNYYANYYQNYYAMNRANAQGQPSPQTTILPSTPGRTEEAQGVRANVPIPLPSIERPPSALTHSVPRPLTTEDVSKGTDEDYLKKEVVEFEPEPQYVVDASLVEEPSSLKAVQAEANKEAQDAKEEPTRIPSYPEAPKFEYRPPEYKNPLPQSNVLSSSETMEKSAILERDVSHSSAEMIDSKEKLPSYITGFGSALDLPKPMYSSNENSSAKASQTYAEIKEPKPTSAKPNVPYEQKQAGVPLHTKHAEEVKFTSSLPSVMQRSQTYSPPQSRQASVSTNVQKSEPRNEPPRLKKYHCPRCNGANSESEARGGKIKCTYCGKTFEAKS